MPDRKKALITGITGQDGSYLADFLLHKSYEVHRIVRRSSSLNRNRIEYVYRDEHLLQKKGAKVEYGSNGRVVGMQRLEGSRIYA